MARVQKGALISSLRGKVGDFIIRRYRNGYVISKVPDISNIKPTKKQKAKRSRFKDAVAYAQSIIRDPEKKAEYKKTLRRGKTVYHSAIKEYLEKNPE